MSKGSLVAITVKIGFTTDVIIVITNANMDPVTMEAPFSHSYKEGHFNYMGYSLGFTMGSTLRCQDHNFNCGHIGYDLNNMIIEQGSMNGTTFTFIIIVRNINFMVIHFMNMDGSI